MILNMVGGGGGNASLNLAYKKLNFSNRYTSTNLVGAKFTLTFPTAGRYYVAFAFAIQRSSSQVLLSPAQASTKYTASNGITLTLIAQDENDPTLYYPSFIVDVITPNATLEIQSNNVSSGVAIYVNCSVDTWRVGSIANDVSLSVTTRTS